MPNYCENTLTVTGSKKDVEKFLNKYVSIDLGYYPNEGPIGINHILDFEKVLPTPLKEDGNITDDWYNWRIENWGTKWNAIENYSFEVCCVDNIDNIPILEVYMDFATAWAPPIGVYEKIAENFKDTDLNIKATYHECGCGFAGEMEFEGGEVIEDLLMEYISNDDVNNINYYAYLMEKGYENSDWLCDEIQIMGDRINIEEEELEKITKEFSKLAKEGSYVEAAIIFINMVNEVKQAEKQEIEQEVEEETIQQ